MRRILLLMLAAVLFAAMALPAAADTALLNTLSVTPDVESAAGSVLVVDRDSGQALYEKNTWDRVYPASTTKLMTALCAAEAVEDLDETKVTVRQDVLDQIPEDQNSLAGLVAGEELTMRQLLYSLMLPSGNDAALVIANYVSGSESAFVEAMNRRAAELGCTDTFFVNSHGLAWREQYSSVWDLARITEAFLQVPALAEIAGTREITFSTSERGEVTMKNTNLLLDPESELYMPEACGVKTGITSQGASFICAGDRDGLRIICVAAGVPAQDAYGYLLSPNPALAEGRKYLDWAYSQFEKVTLCEDRTAFSVPVEGAKKPVAAIPGETVTAVLPKGQAEQLTTVVLPAEGASASPKSGDLAGYVFWYNGETLVAGNIPVYVRGGLGGFPVWMWILLWVLLLSSALLAAMARRNRRRKRAAVPQPAEDDPWSDRPEWMKEVLMDDEDLQ